MSKRRLIICCNLNLETAALKRIWINHYLVTRLALLVVSRGLKSENKKQWKKLCTVRKIIFENLEVE